MSKNTKQIHLILILLIFIIAFNIVRAQNVEPLRETEITNISNKKYYPAVKETLDKSEKSIFVVMYIISMDEKNTQSDVYQLCESLVNAKKRGVEVKVILDQTIDYKRLKNGDEWQNEGGNQNAFSFFKKNEIDVLYDTKAIHTHSKAIVVDENIVILGSTNWSDSALNKNNEASVVIRSKELAGSLIKDFSEIVIDHEMSGDIKEKEPSFAIYRYFLENENLAGKMLNIHDERAFDLYLLLLREFKGDGFPRSIGITMTKSGFDKSEPLKSSLIDFDFGKMAEYLGMDKDTGKTPYRSLITETLKKLKDTYNLIKYETQYGENAKVTLLDPENNDKPYKYPEEKYFTLPGEYFSYGWDRRLSFTGKFCYLINLYEASLNKDSPWWSYPRETLSNHFNSNTTTISGGMTELKKFEIIDIEYSDIENGYETRGPSKYRLYDLYDPMEQAEKIENLKKLYGAEKVDQAREFAKVFFEENDLVVIEDIISLINEYGIDKYQKAIDIISNKAEDNPKRSHKYVVGILRKSHLPDVVGVTSK